MSKVRSIAPARLPTADDVGQPEPIGPVVADLSRRWGRVTDEPERVPKRREAMPCRAPAPSAERLLCGLLGPDPEYLAAAFEVGQ